MTEQETQDWLTVVRSLKHETPYMLIDPNIALKNVKELKKYLPSADIFYAVKSLNDQEIIKKIDTTVAGYDIASLGECESLQALGIAPERMLFSNPTKIQKHIEETFKKGVKRFAFDSVDELHKLAESAPSAEVYLRVIVPDQGSAFSLSKKFGVDSVNAVPMLSMAKELGLNPIGLSFHVGSQSENPYSWQAAIEEMGVVIKRLKKVDIDVTFLNLGGGFPSNYTEGVPEVEQIADVIKSALKEHIPEGVQIVIEPGRYVSASSAVLVSSVSARAQRSGQEWLYMDIGAFNGVIEPLEIADWKYPISLVEDAVGHETTNFVLTGPTCDSCDTFDSGVQLPSVVRRGDRLMIGKAGAYTIEYASNFNGFKVPERYYRR